MTDLRYGKAEIVCFFAVLSDGLYCVVRQILGRFGSLPFSVFGAVLFCFLGGQWFNRHAAQKHFTGSHAPLPPDAL